VNLTVAEISPEKFVENLTVAEKFAREIRQKFSIFNYCPA